MKHSDTNTPAKRQYQKVDRAFIKRVLEHYDKSGRHTLPWRKNITPYKILVSEIMLQQTQVIRVLPKYSLWMKRYPTLSALSKAQLIDILKVWQGLGYQRRAKALYDLSQSVKNIPRSYDELIQLKGIGPYTASALCAFAHDMFPSHLLETNIRTALIEEFHQGETEIHDGKLYDDLYRLTQNIKVQSVGAREWYYALMDYGSHLKSQKISHNNKSAHAIKQSPYAGSSRQLRAATLFAITHGENIPEDERVSSVVDQLLKEGYIVKKGRKYAIA